MRAEREETKNRKDMDKRERDQEGKKTREKQEDKKVLMISF